MRFSMFSGLLAVSWIFLLSAGQVWGQAHDPSHHKSAAMAAQQGIKSPYTGFQSRTIKALSKEREAGLMQGKGIGYALAAELNQYPGPRHALDMASQIELSPKQEQAIQALFDQMQSKAKNLGGLIVAKETALNEAFAKREVTQASLSDLVGQIAALEGQLRTVHLSTHLEMDGLLTPHQAMVYARLRGYGTGAEHTMQHN